MANCSNIIPVLCRKRVKFWPLLSTCGSWAQSVERPTIALQLFSTNILPHGNLLYDHFLYEHMHETTKILTILTSNFMQVNILVHALPFFHVAQSCGTIPVAQARGWYYRQRRHQLNCYCPIKSWCLLQTWRTQGSWWNPAINCP